LYFERFSISIIRTITFLWHRHVDQKLYLVYLH
jgi:hypothetical protein